MNNHDVIEELKERVDKLPKEANWFGNVDAIKILIKKLENEPTNKTTQLR